MILSRPLEPLYCSNFQSGTLGFEFRLWKGIGTLFVTFLMRNNTPQLKIGRHKTVIESAAKSLVLSENLPQLDNSPASFVSFSRRCRSRGESPNHLVRFSYNLISVTSLRSYLPFCPPPANPERKYAAYQQRSNTWMKWLASRRMTASDCQVMCSEVCSAIRVLWVWSKR